MLMLTAVVSFLVLSFAAACRGDFSGFGMIAEGILYIAGILLMCWLFTQPVLLGILIVLALSLLMRVAEIKRNYSNPLK